MCFLILRFITFGSFQFLPGDKNQETKIRMPACINHKGCRNVEQKRNIKLVHAGLFDPILFSRHELSQYHLVDSLNLVFGVFIPQIMKNFMLCFRQFSNVVHVAPMCKYIKTRRFKNFIILRKFTVLKTAVETCVPPRYKTRQRELRAFARDIERHARSHKTRLCAFTT